MLQRKLREAGSSSSFLGDLVVEVFRLNGRLLTEGDDLTRDLGLSSARWQVLGAIRLAGEPLSVAQIARNMGLARQSVQRVADELAAEGFIAFADNPAHRRAKLATLTKKGIAAFEKAMARQAEWARGVVTSASISNDRLQQALRTLRAIRGALEHDTPTR